jgi:hypothetical protein
MTDSGSFYADAFERRPKASLHALADVADLAPEIVQRECVAFCWLNAELISRLRVRRQRPHAALDVLDRPTREILDGRYKLKTIVSHLNFRPSNKFARPSRQSRLCELKPQNRPALTRRALIAAQPREGITLGRKCWARRHVTWQKRAAWPRYSRRSLEIRREQTTLKRAERRGAIAPLCRSPRPTGKGGGNPPREASKITLTTPTACAHARCCNP